MNQAIEYIKMIVERAERLQKRNDVLCKENDQLRDRLQHWKSRTRTVEHANETFATDVQAMRERCSRNRSRDCVLR